MGSDRIDWREDALCSAPLTEQVRLAGVFATPDDFFHIDESNTPGRIHLARLRAVCKACPVINECAMYALTEEPDAWGVLAGMTPAEQRTHKNGLVA